MISFKVSLSVSQPIELKAKLKVETDTFENALPFGDLVIESLPANTEIPDLRLRIVNTPPQIEKNPVVKSHPGSLIKYWWRKIRLRKHSSTVHAEIDN